MNDVDTLRQELLSAQMRRELGEIDDDALAEVEARVLEALRLARIRKEGEGGGGAFQISGSGAGRGGEAAREDDGGPIVDVRSEPAEDAEREAPRAKGISSVDAGVHEE